MRPFLIWILCNLLCSCGNNENINQKQNSRQLQDENFDSFYVHFHKDSVFQLERVQFPLSGFSTEEHEASIGLNDSTTIADNDINFKWKKEDWKVHHLLQDTATFKVKRITSDSTVEEMIYIPDSDFMTKRIFKLVDHQWFLVFFQE